MQYIIKEIKDSQDKIYDVKLEYCGLPVTGRGELLYAATRTSPEEYEEVHDFVDEVYYADSDSVVSFFVENPEKFSELKDIPDEQLEDFVCENYSDLVDKYYEELLDEFEDKAIEEANENYEYRPYEPDYDD